MPRPHRWLWNAVALAVMVVVAFPVYWMFVTSFRDNSDIRSAPRFLPVGTLENYRSVFERDHFWSSFANSLQVTLLTVAPAKLTGRSGPRRLETRVCHSRWWLMNQW